MDLSFTENMVYAEILRPKNKSVVIRFFIFRKGLDVDAINPPPHLVPQIELGPLSSHWKTVMFVYCFSESTYKV